LRLGAGRGVAIEERLRHAGDDLLVARRVLPRVLLRERTVAADDRSPRPASRVGVEGLAVLLHQRDRAVEAVRADVVEVIGEALVRLDAVLRAADGPPKEH